MIIIYRILKILSALNQIYLIYQFKLHITIMTGFPKNNQFRFLIFSQLNKSQINKYTKP